MKIKKKHVLIASPIVVVLLLASFVFFYGMSRNYEEPEDTVAGVGLSDIMAKPDSGTPADYTPQENAAIALGVIRDIGKYNTEMTGDINANIGFMTYVQNMKDIKIVNGDEMYQESVSLSSMANVAQQKYIQDNNKIFLVRSADNISGQNVTWSDDITPISEETYTDTYGLLPNGISPYVVSKSTILSAKVVEESEDKYVYTYELDPETAPAYYRRQVKTLSGSQKNPLFHSVQLTIEMDKDWKPIKITMNENYDISIPVLGSANCTTEYTEVFKDYGEEQDIPDKDLYTTFIRDKYDPNNLASLDGSGETDMKAYLGKVFGADENGLFGLEADVTINGTSQKAYIEGNLQTDTYQIQLGDVFACLKGDRLYLNYGNLKYYITVDGLMEAMENVANAAGFQIPDMDSDFMSQFMENMTTTQKDGMQEMTMNADGMSLVVHLEDGTMKLIDTSLQVNMSGLQLSAYVKPSATGHAFPRIDATYENMLPLMEYINPVIYLVNADSWEFDTNFTLTGEPNITQNAYVKMVRTNSGINAQVDTDILGQHLTVRLVNGMAYVDYGNLKVSLNTTDMDEISKELQSILPAAAGDFSLTDILPQAYLDLFANPDIESLVRNMTPIQVQGNTVSLGFRIRNDTVRFFATKKGNILTDFVLDGISISNAKLNASVKLTAMNASRTTVNTNTSGYVKLEDILSYVEPLMNLANGKTIDLTATLMLRGDLNYNQDVHVLLTKNGNSFDASLSANVLGTQIDLKFINQVAYVDVGNLKLKLHTTDINEIMSEIQQIAPIGGDLPDLSELFPQEYIDLITNFNVADMLQSIQSLQVAHNKLTLVVGSGGLRLEAVRRGDELAAFGLYDLSMQNNKVNLYVKINSSGTQQGTLSVDEAAYTDLADLAKFALPIKNTMNSTSFVFDVDLNMQGQTSLAQNARLTVVRKGSATDLELTADVYGNPLSIKWIDNTAYIQYGAIKISADQYTLSDTLEKLLPGAIPSEFTDFMTNMSIDSILNSVQYLKVNDTTASVGVVLGEQTLSLEISRNDEFITSGRLTGLNVGGSQLDVSMHALYMTPEQLPITVNASEYTTTDEAVPTIRAIMNTVNASSYQFDAQIALSGEQNLTQTAKVKLSRSDNGMNGEVETMIAGQLLDVKLIDGITYVEYGNIKVKFNLADMETIISGIQEILPQDAQNFDISALLPQSYIDAYEQLGINDMVTAFQSNNITLESLQPIFALVGQIETFDLDANGAAVTLNFGGDTISMAANRSYDYISEIHVGGVTVQNSALTLDLTNGVGGKRSLPIRLGNGDYADASDLIGFVKPIQNLLQANSFDFDVNIGLKGDINFNQTANVKLVRDGSNIKAEVSADLYGETLKVTYTDGVTYIAYGNLKVKVDSNDFEEIQQAIKELIPQGTENIDISKLIPQAYLDYFQSEWTLTKIMSSIEGIHVNGNTVSADIKIGDDLITISAIRDGDYLTNATVNGLTVLNGSLTLEATLNQTSTDIWDISVNPDEYFDIKQLLSLSNAVKHAVDATSYEFDVNAALSGEQTFNETAHVRLVRTEQGVQAEISAELEGATLLVQQKDSTTYMQYGELKVKLNNADAQSVMETLKDILPENSFNMDLSKFVPQSYIDWYNGLQLGQFIQDVQSGNINQTTIEPVFKMLQSIASVTADDTSATVSVQVGEDLIPIHVVHDGTNFTNVSLQNLSVLNSKLNLEATVTNITTETLPFTQLNDAEFADVKQIADFMPAVMNTIEANRYAFTGKVQIGDRTVETNVTVIKNGTSADAQVTTTIGGAELTVQYIGNTTYVQYGNIKFMLHDADLQTVIEEIKAVLPADTPAFDLSAILPQAYLDEINALGLEQFISDMQAGNINRESIAPILKLAQKVQLQAQENQLTVSTGLGEDRIQLIVTSQNGLLDTAELSGLTVMGQQTVISAQMNHVDSGVPDITNDGTGYVNIADGIGFVKPIAQLATADTMEFTVNGIASGKLNETLSANVRIQRTENGANAQVTANLYGHDLSVKLIDNITYIDYANMKLQLNTADINEIAEEIRGVLPQDSDLDLSQFLPQSYIDLFENFDAVTLIQKLDNITVSENQIGLDFRLNDNDVIHLTVNKDENQTLSANVSGLQIYDSDVTADIAVVNINEAFTIEAQGDYADVKQLAYFARPVMNAVNANSFRFDANIVLDGKMNINQTAHVQLVLNKDENGAVQGADVHATAEIEGRTLNIKVLGNMTYIQYGDMKLKLNSNDIETIMTRLREILPEGTLGEGADLSAMLPAAYLELIDSFKNGTVNIEQLIGNISNISATDTTAGADIQIGDDVVSVKLTRDGEQLTGGSVQGVTVSDNKLNAVISNLSTEPVAIDPVTDAESYLNVAELVDYVEAGMNSYQQLNHQIFNVKADLNINGHEVKATIVNNQMYLYYHDTTQYKVGGAPYTGIKMQMDYNALLDLAATGVDLLEINLPEDVRQHILGNRVPLDTSVLDALPIPTLDEILASSNVNVNVNILALIKNIQKQGDTLTVTLSSKELFGDASMPDTVITVTKANDGSKNVISAVTVENTGSQDTSITVPSDAANYMDLSSLTTFADSLMKTADLKQYRITGTINANMSIIGIPINANIPMDFRLKLNADNTVQSAYINLDVPYFIGVLQQDMTAKVYYEDGVLYFDRNWETSMGALWWKEYYDHHEYMKCTIDEFMANPMKYVYFCTNFTSMVENAINDAIAKSDQKAVRTGNIMFEEALTGFHYNGSNQWNVNLDAAHLINNSDFSDQMSITVGKGSNGILNSISLSTRVLDMINLQLNNGQLINADKSNVDMSVIPTGLSSNPNYVFGEVKVVETKK